MDEEKVFNDFVEMTNGLAKLSMFHQMTEYPKQMSTFFKKLYMDGYTKGFSDGTIVKENTHRNQN